MHFSLRCSVTLSCSLFLSPKFARVCGVAWGGASGRPSGRLGDGGNAVSKSARDDGRQEDGKAGRSPTAEKAEDDEAPDLTTLTHSGRLLLANCWLWSTLRGHTRTHTHSWTRTSDERTWSACVGECVATCDELCVRLHLQLRIWVPALLSACCCGAAGWCYVPPCTAPSSPASSHVSRLRAISSVGHKRSN